MPSTRSPTPAIRDPATTYCSVEYNGYHSELRHSFVLLGAGRNARSRRSSNLAGEALIAIGGPPGQWRIHEASAASPEGELSHTRSWG